jgi:CelD/BcsL family acetyltransferase involved in cellulose biosynthesis
MTSEPRRGAGPGEGAAEVVVVRTVREFAALREEWDALAALHAQPLIGHDWFLSCVRTLHAEGDLRIVLVRRGGVLIAAAPLALRREHGVARLELLGMHVLHEPSGFLHRDGDALDALVRAVLALGRPLVLQRIDAASAVEPALRRALGGRGWLIARRTGPTVRVALAGDWATFVRGLSGKMRKWQKRARTLAEEIGPVTVEKLAPGTAEVEAHLRVFTALEASGWKGRQRSALLSKQALGAFFHDYMHRAAAAGTLRVWYLRIGSTVAAVQLTLEACRAVWILKIAYDESLARLSPGVQLTFETFRDACAQGYVAYEFIGSADDWKLRWRGELCQRSVLLVYPRSPRGALALGADVLSHGLHAVVGRLRAALARVSTPAPASVAGDET